MHKIGSMGPLRGPGSKGSEGCGGGFAADYKKAGPRPPAFRPKRSGVEKSHAPKERKAGPRPPVISTEAKRSGEISPADGTGSITVGDLSTQSIMGAVLVYLP